MFKDHMEDFSDPAQLGMEKQNKLLHVKKLAHFYRVFTIHVRMRSTDLIVAMSVFDPHHLPDKV